MPRIFFTYFSLSTQGRYIEDKAKIKGRQQRKAHAIFLGQMLGRWVSSGVRYIQISTTMAHKLLYLFFIRGFESPILRHKILVINKLSMVLAVLGQLRVFHKNEIDGLFVGVSHPIELYFTINLSRRMDV